MPLLMLDAADLIFVEPIKVIISAIAVISFDAVKNGYRPLSMHKNITPTPHISTAAKRIIYVTDAKIITKSKLEY